MIKPFLTYQQQIQKLMDEKCLIIKDTAFAAEKLQDLGYFNLIGGYKHPFRDKMTRVYIKNTTFEDVYALYQFDDQLRELFLKYLCQIEMKVRSLLSYAFCEQHGELQCFTPKIRHFADRFTIRMWQTGLILCCNCFPVFTAKKRFSCF